MFGFGTRLMHLDLIIHGNEPLIACPDSPVRPRQSILPRGSLSQSQRKESYTGRAENLLKMRNVYNQNDSFGNIKSENNLSGKKMPMSQLLENGLLVLKIEGLPFLSSCSYREIQPDEKPRFLIQIL